jgi:hypothetical protein
MYIRFALIFKILKYVFQPWVPMQFFGSSFFSRRTEVGPSKKEEELR